MDVKLGLALRVFENRVLRGISGAKRKWREAGEDYIMRSFITYAGCSRETVNYESSITVFSNF
jgi:hypothetical protein